MNKQIYFYLTAILAVLGVLLAVFVVTNLDLNAGQYKYSVVKDGVEFVSNSDEPAVLLEDMRGYESFIIAPAFVQQGPENTYMASSLVHFSTVLSAKQKEVIIAARVIEDGQLIECQSNLGDVTVNKVLSKEDCEQLIGDSFYARIFVEMPDAELEQPRVVLERGVMTIYPNSFDAVSSVSFTAVENLYTDSSAIIGSVNDLLGRVKG